MAIITVQGITKQFGTQIVLDNVSLSINAGETVGLYGINGSGKTTLFRMITGDSEPDMGTITRAKSIEIGHLNQEPKYNPVHTLHEEVGSVFDDLLALETKLHHLADQLAHKHNDLSYPKLLADYEKVDHQFVAAGGHKFEARMGEILSGLGFTQLDHDKPMSILSAGQRCRVALAKILLEDKPFLLLDEPTNHLDIDTVRWLEKYMDGHRGGAVIISHDRYLLDRLCTRIIEIAHRRVASYPGNYSNFAQTKALQLLTEGRQFEQDQAFIKKEQAYIDKHLAGQRTRQAKGRRKRLERRLGAGEFITQRTANQKKTKISFDKTTTSDVTILRCDELRMNFGDHVLFNDLTLQVQNGDRFAITGPNGTGKSTLLKIIMNELEPTGGEFTLAPKLKIGYYAQQAAHLDPDKTVLEIIRGVRPEFSEEAARSYMGQFLFTGQDVFKTINLLSGGEVSRVRLASLILSAPDVLILDEPTNHLDIPSCEVLEEALSEFGGTIIVVSHDRYFLDRIADKLLVIRPDHHTLYAGNYSYYVEQLEQQKNDVQKNRVKPAKKTKNKKNSAATISATKKTGPSPYDSLSIDELEQMVLDLETKLSNLQEKFGDPVILKDPTALTKLRQQIEEVSTELAEVDTAWQQRAELQ